MAQRLDLLDGQRVKSLSSRSRSRVRNAIARSYMPIAASFVPFDENIARRGHPQAGPVACRVHRVGQPAGVFRRGLRPGRDTTPVPRDRRFEQRPIGKLDLHHVGAANQRHDSEDRRRRWRAAAAKTARLRPAPTRRTRLP